MTDRKLSPLIALAFVLVFLFVNIIAQTIASVVEHTLVKDAAYALSPLGSVISMGASTLITIIIFLWAKWAVVSRNYIMTRPWMVLSWSVVAALGAIIPSVFLQELMPEWPDAIQRLVDEAAQQMIGIMNTPGGYAVVCLLAPIAEELVFRGAVLRKLLQWKPEHRWLMICLSAMLFAMAHMNPAQFLHPLLIGILLGWMYERTGSIIPGIAYHWCNNTVAFLLSRLYQDPDITVTEILGSQSRALMAVAFSLLIFIPAVYQLNIWMKKR